MDTEIVNVQQAGAILAQKYGRPVEKMQEHIRQLRRYEKLQAINEGENTRAYLFRRSDVEAVELGSPRVRGVRSPRKTEKRD